MGEPPGDILALADEVHKGVVSDAAAHAPRARALVERARREGPPEALVVALRAHAWAERLALRNTSARALLDEAAALAEASGLPHRLGEVLVSRVVVLHELGRLDDARRDADRAAALLPEHGQPELAFQQAALLQNVGHLGAAAVLYRRVLADPASPAVVRAKAGNNLAHLEGQLGRTDVALAVLDVAAALAEQVAPTVAAYCALTRAFVQVRAGRLSESLADFDEARRRYERAGLPLGELHLEQAEALGALHLLPEAVGAATQAVAGLPAGEVSLMAAEAQLALARLSLQAGDLPVAGPAADHAADLLRRQGRTGWLARVEVLRVEARHAAGLAGAADLRALQRQAAVLERCGLRSDAVEAHLLAGRLAVAAGRPRAAAAGWEAAVRLARGTPVLVRLRGRVAQALLAQQSSDRARALAACRAGLRDVDLHRRALPSTELQVRASTYGEELGTLGLRALLPAAATSGPAPRTAATVFAWLDRTRGAALAPLEAPGDDAAAGDAAGADDPGADDLAALRTLQAELTALQQQGLAEPPGLVRRVVEAEAAVRRASWVRRQDSQDSRAGAAARPAVTAGQVRARLDGAQLVSYGALDGRLLATVLDRRGTRLVELGPVDGLGPQVDALLFALRRLARPVVAAALTTAARRSAEHGLAALRARLVAPLGLDPQAPLVVVPVGELQRLPWAPLHGGPTTVVPSARLWLRTLDARADPSRVALVAGPGLAGSEAEVAALRALHPGATVLTGPDSTCAATLAAVRGAGLAHVACHGRLRSDNPAFSALLLADGPLTVHELSRRDGAPTRVVLAACESGAQVGFPGGEALGLVSALLARGSAGVVASTVLVPDEQAVPLMTALHGALAGGATTSVALWRARADLDRDDPAQLAAWCAFDAAGGA